MLYVITHEKFFDFENSPFLDKIFVSGNYKFLIKLANNLS